jgi:hypothetical protein
MRYSFEPDNLSVTCGTITRGNVSAPSQYIFLKDKPVWFDLPENEAKHIDGFGPNFEGRLRKWKETKATKALA